MSNNDAMSTGDWWLAFLGWLEKTQHYLYRECYFFDNDMAKEDCIVIYNEASKLEEEAYCLFITYEHVIHDIPIYEYEDDDFKSIQAAYGELLSFILELEDIVKKDTMLRIEI